VQESYVVAPLKNLAIPKLLTTPGKKLITLFLDAVQNQNSFNVNVSWKLAVDESL
jgi:hypothetical protein